MSDLFQEKVPLEYIKKAFQIMAEANWHIFQILTKRSDRLLELSTKLNWPPNVWIGVSIETKKYTYRSKDLSKVPAAVRFLSVEPLLEMIPNLPLKNIDWAIVGGESGRYARLMELEWARSIRNQCENAGVAFFLKQLGGRFDKRGGQKALLDGRTWREFPRTHQESQKSVLGI